MAEKSGKTARRPGPGKPFEKGKSGNPGGRPKVIAEVQELARAQTQAAINALVEIMSGKKNPPAARVSAATALLDRGYGKPAQALTGANGSALIPTVPTINLTMAQARG